jgi:hypothetical protein
MRWLVMVILCTALFHFHGEWKHSQGVKQGRTEKHAEMMEFISGSQDARIAIVSQRQKVTIHPQGTCVVCHRQAEKDSVAALW